MPYRQPMRVEIGKNIQADFCEGWTMVRTITAIEAVVPVTPGYLSKNLLAGCFKCNCRTIAMRVWANVAAAAPVIQMACESPSGPPLATDVQFVPSSQPEPAFVGTLTMSGQTCALFCPITGAADVDTWSACSAFAPGVGHPTESIVEIPAIACAGAEKIFTLDTLGRTLFYPFCTNLSTATRIVVGMKRLE